MNREDFEQVFDRQIDQSRTVLVEKAKQYADDTDRLHNFKVASAFTGETAEQALWGMEVKHLVSLSDMVRLDNFYPPEVWDEKIGDAINYLILLRAQVFETDSKRTTSETSDSSEVPEPSSVAFNLQIPPPNSIATDKGR